MKYVTVSLSQDPETRHPMHQFVVETEGYTASELLGSTVSEEGVHTALFHVHGWPPDRYETTLLDVGTVDEYALSEQPDDSFTVYVRETLVDVDRRLLGAFHRTGLVTLFPVVFFQNGTVEVTVVGPDREVQAALDAVPATVSVDVVDIGAYRNRRVDGGSGLTDRQYEAVAAAVECGYYDDPRAAGTDDIASELGCAPSTAAEHLRRAERTVMGQLVDGL